MELAVVTGSSAVNSRHAGRRCSLGDRDGLCGGIRRGGAIALLHDGEHSGRHAIQIMRRAAGGEVRNSRAGHGIFTAVYKIAQRTAIGTGGSEGRAGLSLRRQAAVGVDGYGLTVGRQLRAGGLDAHKVGAVRQAGDFGAAASRPCASAGLLILHRGRHILELAVVTGSSAVNSGHADRRCSLGDRDDLCGGIRRGGAVALLHNIDGTGGQTSKGNISGRCNIRPRAAVDLILQAAVHTAQRTAIGTGGSKGRGGRGLLGLCRCTNQRDSSICRGRTGDLNLRKVNASYIHAVDRCNRIADWEIVAGIRCVDHIGHGAGQAGLVGGARGESHACSCRDVHAIGRGRGSLWLIGSNAVGSIHIGVIFSGKARGGRRKRRAAISLAFPLDRHLADLRQVQSAHRTNAIAESLIACLVYIDLNRAIGVDGHTRIAKNAVAGV